MLLAVVTASAVLPATLGSVPAASAGVDPVVGVPTTRPCTFDATVACGTIHVPAYWQTYEDGDPTIRVRFRVYPNTDPTVEAREPLVGFAGGPGSGSIGSVNTYMSVLGTELRRFHPVLVMDYRGTRSSQAIDCDELQHGTLPDFVDQAAACGEQLGETANAYGNAASSRDLDAIVDGLGIDKVSLYGTSAGSIAAASFAANFPEHVRAAVLDGAYDDKFDPFARDGADGMVNTYTKLCERAGTCGAFFDEVQELAAQLEDEPYTGIGYNSFGIRKKVTITPAFLAQMMYDGTFATTTLRDFPAAVHAFLEAGDDTALMRIAASIVTGYASGGTARGYSYGYYMAVYCRDNPPIFDREADPATRRAQLEAQVAAMPDDTFFPFTKDAYMHHQYQYELTYGCLEWPAPPFEDPALPVATPYPDVPVLVLNGEFDFTTPPEGAMGVASRFPNSSYVEIANAGHVVARSNACALGIFRSFIETLDTGDAACASEAVPDVKVVPAFPVRLSDAPEIDAAGAGEGDRSTALERRVAWAATWTLGEALARRRSFAPGLRGGSYSASGSTITFDRTKFVRDLKVSGTATVDSTLFEVTADLDLVIPNEGQGNLTIRFDTDPKAATATVRGRINGRRIVLTTPAPWSIR